MGPESVSLYSTDPRQQGNDSVVSLTSVGKFGDLGDLQESYLLKRRQKSFLSIISREKYDACKMNYSPDCLCFSELAYLYPQTHMKHN